jgi:hypothetical protein
VQVLLYVLLLLLLWLMYHQRRNPGHQRSPGAERIGSQPFCHQIKKGREYYRARKQATLLTCMNGALLTNLEPFAALQTEVTK